MECTVSKQATTQYWDTTVSDLYVRAVTADVAQTSETALTAVDYNNSVSTNGQDWFVYEPDSSRNDDDHLCTSSSTSGIECSQIRCVARRKMVTEDSDDHSFTPTDSDTNADYMNFPAYHSYILFNQSLVTSKQSMMNLIDSKIQIGMGAMDSNLINVAATFGAVAALALF